MDIRKMTTAQLVASVADHDETSDRVISELARRLEAAESLNNVYRTEIDACRNERRVFFSRTMNYEEWQAASKQAEIAMAATDAALEVK